MSDEVFHTLFSEIIYDEKIGRNMVQNICKRDPDYMDRVVSMINYILDNLYENNLNDAIYAITTMNHESNERYRRDILKYYSEKYPGYYIEYIPYNFANKDIVPLTKMINKYPKIICNNIMQNVSICHQALNEYERKYGRSSKMRSEILNKLSHERERLRYNVVSWSDTDEELIRNTLENIFILEMQVKN